MDCYGKRLHSDNLNRRQITDARAWPVVRTDLLVTVDRYRFLARRPARRVRQLRGHFIGVLLVAVLAQPAAGEVLLSDASIEISANGPRASRNCTVLLKPARTLGDDLAPRLALVTAGTQLSFGIDKPAQYSSQVIVQNNTRRVFGMTSNASVDQFRLSDIGKALRSQRLFFVTAQLSGSGKFVSSRYDRVDLDAILAKIGSVCPFDAEMFMADQSSQGGTERSLPISSSDLTLIRWVLNKKYGGLSSRPEPSSSLSPLERTYLKRYASDNGLTISQYLTSDIARRLIADGQLLANLAIPAPTAAAPIPPSKPSERVFFSYDNTDFDGDDIKPWLMNSNLSDCRMACTGNSACRAFTFNKRRDVCILKTGTGRPKPSSEAISVSMTPVSIPVVRVTVLNGVDLRGGDLDMRGLRNVSLDQCANACLSNDSCAGFSYVKSKSWCWMKRQLLDRRLNDDVVSGVK
jgi:hypothetical protein